jgi:hypothetical protein
LPLEIKPAKGGMSTLYLRIPKDVMKMYNITRDTPFTFELVDYEEGIRLMYRLQAVVGKRKEKEKENEKA